MIQKESSFLLKNKNILKHIKQSDSYKSYLRKKIIFNNKQKIQIDEIGDNSKLIKNNSILKEKINIIKKENKTMKKLYEVIKKKYEYDFRETFFNIINQYKNKNYNITDNTLKSNIFSRSPLLLEHKELDNYYLGLKYNKLKTDALNKYKQKYLLFLNKENKSLILSKSLLRHKSLKNVLEEENKKINKNFSCSNFEINDKFEKININCRNNVYNNREINNKKIYKEKLKKEIKEDQNIIKKLIQTDKYLNSNIKSNRILFTSNLTPKRLSIPKLELNKININNIPINKIYFSSKRKKTENNFSRNFLTNKSYRNFSSTRRSSFSGSNKINLIKINNPYHINVINLFKKNNINSNVILNNLLKEKNKSKFLEELQKINITKFSKKQLEILINYYCKTFLKFNDKKIKNILNTKNTDIDKEVFLLINNFVKKNNKISYNKNIKKENNSLSYKIIKDLDEKAFKLQRALVKNKAIE